MTGLPAVPVPTLTVFDLEFTAWKSSMASHWLRPGEFQEVVQIGAVKLDGVSFAILDEFTVLVRPRINPILSDYLQDLTGITNQMLQDSGMDFVTAYARFAAFAGTGTICAFGHDEKVLGDNIRLYGLKGMARLPAFFDLRAWFSGAGLDPRGLSSCEIGPALGAPFEGRAHNALDDARSLARAMAILAVRGASPVMPVAA